MTLPGNVVCYLSMQVERACCCLGKQQGIHELGKQVGGGKVMTVLAPD